MPRNESDSENATIEKRGKYYRIDGYPTPGEISRRCRGKVKSSLKNSVTQHVEDLKKFCRKLDLYVKSRHLKFNSAEYIICFILF